MRKAVQSSGWRVLGWDIVDSRGRSYYCDQCDRGSGHPARVSANPNPRAVGNETISFYNNNILSPTPLIESAVPLSFPFPSRSFFFVISYQRHVVLCHWTPQGDRPRSLAKPLFPCQCMMTHPRNTRGLVLRQYRRPGACSQGEHLAGIFL